MDLRNFTFDELGGYLAERAVPGYRCAQVFEWIYRKGASDFDAMTSLPKAFRLELARESSIAPLTVDACQHASDGTKKYRFRLDAGAVIESVFIPADSEEGGLRNTICISTQAGCAMGCGFCHTATMKLVRNLSTAEIVAQVLAVRADNPDQRITNIVLMGMGEPLHNYDAVVRALRILMDARGLDFSHRRITLSTVGLVPELRRLGQDVPVNLAVSLHAASDELRDEIVPINKKYPLAELMAACRDYPMPPRKRITFEYVVLPGVNDRSRDASDLQRVLKGIPCKINLIPFNAFPGAGFRTPTLDEVYAFQARLNAHGFHALVRTPRGRDVLAACGQLAAEGRRTPLAKAS